MAAASYYTNVPAHHSNIDFSDGSRPPTPLKPMYLAQNHPRFDGDDPLQSIQKVDETLKKRIRTLRLISRILATGISLAVLVPITMTLHKFLTTQNVYRTVDTPTGQITRTAWALKTKAWPTYMYFSIALTSFVLNLSALIGYLRSVKTANLTSTISTVFSSLILVANIVVWCVAAAIYRYEKSVTENGKNNDLWGWTCSGAARAIQKAFEKEVPFDKYCNVQTASWYAGLVQIGAMILSIIIYLLAVRRMQAKQVVRRSMSDRLISSH